MSMCPMGLLQAFEKDRSSAGPLELHTALDPEACRETES